MSVNNILIILQKSPKFEEFLKRNPEYDTISRSISVVDMERIQEEYPELNLFPHPTDEVIAITIVSRILMQKGYPKLKAYIDVKKSEILHIFVSE